MALVLTSHQHAKHTVFSHEFCSEDSSYQFEWVTKDHPDRASLQTFIATTFYKTYGANIHHFSDILVGCKDERGQWLAALGFSFLDQKKAFLESYLDLSLEMEIAAHIQDNVLRSQIIEVGNLAAIHAGAGRTLIINMTRYLHEQGYKWVAFTATKNLLNSFKRLGIQLVSLAKADPKRLPDAGQLWGNYYSTQPEVMFGNIASGYAQLAE